MHMNFNVVDKGLESGQLGDKRLGPPKINSLSLILEVNVVARISKWIL